MADVEMIADDLEEEFRKLCGEDQPASLQACDRVRKAVNNIEVRIVAEVSKVMRCGHPGRDKIEQEEASRQRCELEELAEVKKRLAEREAELLRLRQQVELPMGTVKESAAEEHPGWLRRQRIQGKDDDSRAQDSEQMGSPRYLALLEVRPYSGEDPAYSGEDPAYGFDAFLESFVLKYPRDSWARAERGVLLRSKLTGRARKQYEALPAAIREGSFDAQVEALRGACRAEARNHRIVALGEFKKLRMKEGQSVADFCVELERLTRRAHPQMDEAALDAQRAQLLYEHLAHWNDSYHLMKVRRMKG
ncbi:unnamed protein product [Heligmosomoides polygyrus]|uniref:Retrotrans_gag domain-containing protein n=1 Tax=Heligmosomoides polygyrus TaxID=6339 RepID=A0A183GV29_HELPZ|nr:unnamed protein product [Heligmosomoides polygyrus]